MKKEYRINKQIEERIVDLVHPDKGLEKNMNINDALAIAVEKGLDLVEVSPAKDKKNSICKIIDYGKLKYKESKKHKAHKQVTKEIRFNVNISVHDLEVKNKKVHEFLEKKYIVRYSMEIRGYREKSFIEEARDKMEEYVEEFKEQATWVPLKIYPSGNRIMRISTVLSPIKKN